MNWNLTLVFRHRIFHGAWCQRDRPRHVGVSALLTTGNARLRDGSPQLRIKPDFLSRFSWSAISLETNGG